MKFEKENKRLIRMLFSVCLLVHTACFFSKKNPEPDKSETKTVEGNGTGFGGENGVGYSGLIKKTNSKSIIPKPRKLSTRTHAKKPQEDGFKYVEAATGKEKSGNLSLAKTNTHSLHWKQSNSQEEQESNSEQHENSEKTSPGESLEVENESYATSEEAHENSNAATEIEEETEVKPHTSRPNPTPTPLATKSQPFSTVFNATTGQLSYPQIVTHEVTISPSGGPSNASYIEINGFSAATPNLSAFVPYQNRYATIPAQEEDFNLEGSNFTIETYFLVTSNNIIDHVTLAAQYPDDFSSSFLQQPTWKLYARDGQVEFEWRGKCPVARDKTKKRDCGNLVIAREKLERNKWHHVAAVRNGRFIQIYLDGRLHNTADTMNGELFTSHREIILGKSESIIPQYPQPMKYVSGFNGRISQFQFTKGKAKYLKDFDALLED